MVVMFLFPVRGRIGVLRNTSILEAVDKPRVSEF